MKSFTFHHIPNKYKYCSIQHINLCTLYLQYHHCKKFIFQISLRFRSLLLQFSIEGVFKFMIPNAHLKVYYVVMLRHKTFS